MRVLVVSHSAAMGGAERAIARTVELLVARGHNVQVTVPADGPLSALLRAVGLAADDIVVLPTHRWVSPRARRPAGVARIVQCLADVPSHVRFQRRLRPDVVVVNTLTIPAPLVAARLAGVPLVTIAREAVRTNPVMATFFPRAWVLWAVRRLSTLVVAVSHFVATQVGVDRVVLEHVRADAVASVARLAPSAPFRAVMIGAITPDKGQIDAARATADARDRGADVQLSVYGTGRRQDVDALRQEIESLVLGEHVLLRGEVPAAPEVLEGADLLVMASRNEGFGRVTVEALQMGVPVLAYDCGGTREALREGGGMLVPPHPAPLGDALYRLATTPDEWQRLRTEASIAGRIWSQSTTDQELVDVIESVAAARREAGR